MEQLKLDIDGLYDEALDRQTDRQTDRQQLSLAEKVDESLKAIQLAADMSKTYYNEPLIITYSGGKDSDVLLHLAEKVLKPDEFEVLNSHTSVDAPPTVYHIREVFKELEAKGVKTTIHQPRDKDGQPITMWNLIPKKLIPPTRFARYCCQILKESSTPNRICCVGVRAAESTKRKGRDIFATRGGSTQKHYFFHLTMRQKYIKSLKRFKMTHGIVL